MADIYEVKINGVAYNIQDSFAQTAITELKETINTINATLTDLQGRVSALEQTSDGGEE